MPKMETSQAAMPSQAESSQPKSQSDISEADTHHRKVSTWLSEELHSISDSIPKLKSLIPSDNGPMSNLKALVDNNIEEILGQTRSKIVKNLLGVVSQQSGLKYSPLVADLEDLKKTLVMLHGILKESLDSYPKTTDTKLPFFKAAKASTPLLTTTKAVQEKVQVADRSLDLLLASMKITAALEQRYLVEVRDLRADLQRFVVGETRAHTS